MQNSSKKILTLPLRLAIIVTLYGALFKIMHWPYAQQLLLIGCSSIIVLYTIRFLFKNQKKKLDYIKAGFIIFWSLGYFNNALHLVSLPYVFEVLYTILFFWWFIEEGLTYFYERELKSYKPLKIFYKTVLALTAILIFIGLFFKIMHWPYGNIAFTLGILLLSAMLIIDYFAVKRQVV